MSRKGGVKRFDRPVDGSRGPVNGRHGVPLTASRRAKSSSSGDQKDDIVLFSPSDPENVIRWGTPFRDRIRICEDELNRWRYERLLAIRELEDIDATPEMFSARLTIVDVRHDVDRLARMFRSFAKGSRTIGKPSDARKYDSVADDIEHRFDDIDIVSVDGDGVVHDA